MRNFIEMGFDISVNAYSFQDNDSLKMVRDLPLDRLHLETDSPWGKLDRKEGGVVHKYLKNAPHFLLTKEAQKY